MRGSGVSIVASGLLAACLAALPAAAEPGWPQYRGPARDGAAAAAERAPGWPEGGPRVVWREPLGSAFSQLVVASGGVYTGASDEASEYLVRLDAATGKETWRVRLGEVFVSEFGNGPRSTPTVDGDVVFQLGARGKLVAAAAADGKVLWSVDLTERFGSSVPRFGYSGSPLVTGELLVLEVGAADRGWLAALDRKTGATRWTSGSGAAGYSSPIVLDFEGRPQLVLVHGKTVLGLDLEGRTLWTHELEEGALAMPLRVAPDRIFVSSSGDTGCALLRLARSADGAIAVERVWQNRNMRNHFNSSVLSGGHIYGFDNATLKCLSAETGELMWAKRGLGKGSLLVSGNQLLVVSDRGQVLLVEANPQEYRERGAIEALAGKSWTAPSFAGGRLYLRNLSEAACLDFRG